MANINAHTYTLFLLVLLYFVCRYARDYKNEQFFRKCYDGGEGQYLIFAAQDFLPLLPESTLHMDGTFKCVPTMFDQLFSIHASQFGHVSLLVKLYT